LGDEGKAAGCHGTPWRLCCVAARAHQVLRCNSSGSLAILAAIRRASSRRGPRLGRMLKKDSRLPSFRIQMFFDKFFHGFVGFFNFLRIAAFKPMFSLIDWNKGERNALLLEFLRHQL
jgi:hypothetical protein